MRTEPRGRWQALVLCPYGPSKVGSPKCSGPKIKTFVGHFTSVIFSGDYHLPMKTDKERQHLIRDFE